jgi:ligand-binding sensor domain-containing protein
MKRVFISVTGALCLLAQLAAEAQPVTEYVVANHYDINSGLSNNTVHDILLDSEGFIWLATRSGLNRFDGKNFKVYQHEPGVQYTLSSSFIWTILEDSQNNLWVGTSGGGLNLFDRKSGRFHSFEHDTSNPNSISFNTVTALFEDSEGTLWIGTEGGGVNVLEHYVISEDEVSAHFIRISELDVEKGGLPVDIVLDIDEDKYGNVWIATYGEGVYRYHRETGEFEKAFTDADPHTMSLHADGDGRIWIGTKYGGIYIYELKSDQYVQADLENQAVPIDTNFIWPVITDSYGSVWVGSFGRGLFRADVDSDALIDVKDRVEVEGAHILSIIEDDDGLIWIGTDNSGFTVVASQNHFTKPDWKFSGNTELESLNILYYYEDSADRVWLGTGSGLYIKREENKPFERFYDIPSNKLVEHITESSAGEILISTNIGLYKVSSETMLTQRVELNIEDSSISIIDRVNHILETDDAYWVSTNAGLIKLDHEFDLIEHYRYQENHPQGLSGNNIRKSIYQDGDIWVLAAHAGVSVINQDGSVATFTVDSHGHKGLLTDRVSDIVVLPNGDAWITTLDAGLFFYKSDEDLFEQFQLSGSAASNTIHRILKASENRFLLATQEGLHSFDIREMGSVRIYFHSRDRSQYTGRIFPTSSHGILVTQNSGAMFLSNENLISDRVYEAPVRFTDIQVNYSPIHTFGDEWLHTGLSLNHYEKSLLFEFALLDYHNPNLNRYDYMLEGIDDTWIHAGERNMANYSNLPSGNFTFKIRASGPAGIISSSVIELPIAISTPFWETWWFRFLTIGSFLFGCYCLYRYRLKYILKEEKVRLGLAKDLHDDVSSTLSSISFFAQAIKRPGSTDLDKERFLKLISQSSDEAKEKINDIIWVIHPKDDSWETLLLKCKRYASDILDAQNIAYTFEVSGKPPANIQVVVKKNTWLIFKELITNIVKHADAGELKFYFKLTESISFCL